MMVLVTGAAAGGKSGIAEEIALGLSGRVLYAATMLPDGEEGKERIARHLKLREGKGFNSVDHYVRIGELPCQGADTLLIECLSNLLANEMFGGNGAKEGWRGSILGGISALLGKGKNIVIVTSDVFADGGRYKAGTEAYAKALGELNCSVAAASSVVVEAVAGLKVYLKGKPL